MIGKRSIALCMWAFMAAASAQGGDELMQKSINDEGGSWGIWGKADIATIKDPTLPVGTASRVTISTQPNKPWDIGAYIKTNKPIKKGDVIVLSLWARAEKLPEGNDFIEIYGRVYDSGPAGTSLVPETHFLIGKAWKRFVAVGMADKDYAAGKLGCGIVLGTGAQTIDFGPAYVSDFGPGYDTSKLPHE